MPFARLRNFRRQTRFRRSGRDSGTAGACALRGSGFRASLARHARDDCARQSRGARGLYGGADGRHAVAACHLVCIAARGSGAFRRQGGSVARDGGDRDCVADCCCRAGDARLAGVASRRAALGALRSFCARGDLPGCDHCDRRTGSSARRRSRRSGWRGHVSFPRGQRDGSHHASQPRRTHPLRQSREPGHARTCAGTASGTGACGPRSSR